MSQKYHIGDMLPTRKLLGDAISELADMDERVWALSSDCGGNMGTFIQKHKDRFVDDGIAEQNAAGIAAGLALSGAVPYIMGMAPFVTMRAFEQNRSAIGYQNLPVRIVGYVAGMTTGGGSTHYAMEDIAVMSAITNMAVLSISDPLLGAEAIRLGRDYPAPYYLRCGNGKADPVIYELDSVKLEIGKGILARQGSDVTILTHGVMVKHAMHVADAMREEGIHVEVIDLFTIKPLDSALICDSVKKTGKVIVWEDHRTIGGLSTAVADLLIGQKIMPEAFVRVGIPQVYPGFGSDNALYRKYHMDEESVSQTIRTLVRTGCGIGCTGETV